MTGGQKAVIYCRVSTKEQIENFSLGNQRKACEAVLRAARA